MYDSSVATLGTDGEAFIVGPDGKIRNSQGIIPGEKGNPFKTKHGAVHRDNVLAEFNTKEASTVTQFVSNTVKAISDLEALVQKQECSLAFIPSHRMEAKWLLCKEAQVFGCEPDFDAWYIDPAIATTRQGNLRTAGGHVHVGIDLENEEDLIAAVRACDLYVGVPSILIDTDVDRRKMYGRAGHFRVKPYGFEYRVLSNFWYTSTTLMNSIGKRIIRAVNNRGDVVDWTASSALSDQIRQAINNSDVEMAQHIMNRYAIPSL